VISTTPRTLTLSRRESRLPLGARRACRTRTGTSPAIVIRRGRHHLPQAAKLQPLFSWSSACPLNPVIRFAVGRRQVTTTDRDQQSAIRSLQYAHNDYVLFVDLEVLPSEWYVIAGYGRLPMLSG
jgi:hypothetical protein